MPLLTVTALKIDGVVIPAPKVKGMKIKHTVDIEWPPLTVEQVRLIESVVSNEDKPFVSMEFTDQTGQTKTMTVYFGTPTYTDFDWIGGQWMVTDAAVSAIEQ